MGRRLMYICVFTQIVFSMILSPQLSSRPLITGDTQLCSMAYDILAEYERLGFPMPSKRVLIQFCNRSSVIPEGYHAVLQVTSYEYLIYVKPDNGIDYRICLAHELFHIIQYEYGYLHWAFTQSKKYDDMHMWITEGMTTAVAYLINDEEPRRYVNKYIYRLQSLFKKDYEASVFWWFIIEYYGWDFIRSFYENFNYNNWLNYTLNKCNMTWNTLVFAMWTLNKGLYEPHNPSRYNYHSMGAYSFIIYNMTGYHSCEVHQVGNATITVLYIVKYGDVYTPIYVEKTHPGGNVIEYPPFFMRTLMLHPRQWYLAFINMPENINQTVRFTLRV